jgi:hypothetical protein
MVPFKFSFPTSGGFPILLALLWLVYIALYWRALVLVIRASKFDTTDKILWFLVITMAPVIGLITFHAMCPPHLRELGTEGKPPGDS